MKIQVKGVLIPRPKRYDDDTQVIFRPLTAEQEQRQLERFEQQREADLTWEKELLSKCRR